MLEQADYAYMPNHALHKPKAAAPREDEDAAESP
jgi:hypothetical protein